MNYMITPPDNRTVNPTSQHHNDPIHEGKALIHFLEALSKNLESIHHKLEQNQIDIDMYLYEPTSGSIQIQSATFPGGYRGVWKLSDIIANWNTAFLNPSASVYGNGSVTSPGATTTIATIPAASLPAGTYQVQVVINMAGTTGAGDNNNVQLIGGGVSPIRLDNDATVISSFNLGNIVMNGSNALTVQSVAAGTVGAIYQAEIIATPLVTVESATLQIKERIIPLLANAGQFQAIGLSGNLLLSERDKITLTVTPAVPCFLEVLGSADYRKIDRQES